MISQFIYANKVFVKEQLVKSLTSVNEGYGKELTEGNTCNIKM